MAAIVRSARFRRLARAAALLALSTLVVDSAVAPARAQSGAPSAAPCDIRTTERVVAIGDVHGAHARFVELLRTVRLIDQRDRWIGNRAILVQTGDILDRGADSRKTLDLLRRLERDADQAGGKVYALLGNHEVMRMIRDWRYVSAGEYAAFRRADSADTRDRVYEAALAQAEESARADKRRLDVNAFRDQFMKDVPLGAIEMRQAFSSDGEYGRWLRTHVAMVQINGVAFVHGGVSPALASLGCAGINAAVAKDLAEPSPTLAQGLAMFSSQESGPLWYRGLVTEPETLTPQVPAVLRALGVRAMVVGHSVSSTLRVATHYEGRVIQIDTGMLGGAVYRNGQPSALEIVGETFTAVYLNSRDALPTPQP
ncbi:MAG: metallophosphoesterase [Vicinamibacterales bacterium]